MLAGHVCSVPAGHRHRASSKRHKTRAPNYCTRERAGPERGNLVLHDLQAVVRQAGVQPIADGRAGLCVEAEQLLVPVPHSIRRQRPLAVVVEWDVVEFIVDCGLRCTRWWLRGYDVRPARHDGGASRASRAAKAASPGGRRELRPASSLKFSPRARLLRGELVTSASLVPAMWALPLMQHTKKQWKWARRWPEPSVPQERAGAKTGTRKAGPSLADVAPLSH